MKRIPEKIKTIYRSLRIQTKLTITHLLIATIPMIIVAIFFSTKLYDMVVADTIQTEQASSAKTAPLIEKSIQGILDTKDVISQIGIYKKITAYSGKQDAAKICTGEEVRKFSNIVSELIGMKNVTDIKLYLDLPQNADIFNNSTPEDMFLPINNARGTYWYGIFKGDPTSNTLFCPSFYLGSYELKHNGEMAYITRSTIKYKGEMTSCYLAIYFSEDEINQLLKDNLSSDTSVAYIINSRDTMVATTDVAQSGTYHFSYDSVQDNFMSSNNFIKKRVAGNEVYAGFYNISNANTDWYMVVAMPTQPLIHRSQMIILGFVFTYLLCILFALIVASFLSHSITNRISAMVHQMSKARNEKLPKALPSATSTDELGELIDSYNYMTRVIEQLMNDQKKASEDLRIAEFNSLQAQINPHFLYNTMDMINWLAQQGRTTEVTKCVQKLSRFYKLTLSRKQSLSTIEHEIEHVSIYADLQNMRFHDNIEFIVDLPDNLMDYSIPKLTFQPIVENSILHGILEKEDKKGTIVLTGWLEDGDLVILISDDGIGMDHNTVRLLLSSEPVPGSTGTNIAVYNTHRRLQTLFGPQYGLAYHSTPGEGTEVEIRLPAFLPEESDS